LKKYEYLKKNLDKDIEKQVTEFHEIIEKSHKELDFEQKRHIEILEALNIEKREIHIKEHRLTTLEQKEDELMKRLQEIMLLSKELQKRIESEKYSIHNSKKITINLENSVNEIEKNIIKKREYIEPMLERAQKHEEQILRLQQEILAKAQEKTSAIKSQVQESVKATTEFEKFFEKKDSINNLIQKIENEKKELEQQFTILRKKALSFDLSIKSSNGRTYVKELEKNLNSTDKKRSVLRNDLEKLIKLIKGK